MTKTVQLTYGTQAKPKGSALAAFVQVMMLDAAGAAVQSKRIECTDGKPDDDGCIFTDVAPGTGYTVRAVALDTDGTPTAEPVVSQPFDVAAPDPQPQDVSVTFVAGVEVA